VTVQYHEANLYIHTHNKFELLPNFETILFTIAVCRFASETAPLRALSAVERGAFEIFGHIPKVTLIERPLVRNRPDSIARRAVSSPSVPPLPKPSLGRRRSHQRNTVTIDTLISQTPHILELVNKEVAMVSPMSSSSVLHPASDCVTGCPTIPSVSPTSAVVFTGSVWESDFHLSK
jgi:hypothetical protein